MIQKIVFFLEKISNREVYNWFDTKIHVIRDLKMRVWPQFYIQLVFKAPLFITLTISDQNHYLNREW